MMLGGDESLAGNWEGGRGIRRAVEGTGFSEVVGCWEEAMMRGVGIGIDVFYVVA
jgi:hypothetical protein